MLIFYKIISLGLHGEDLGFRDRFMQAISQLIKNNQHSVPEGFIYDFEKLNKKPAVSDESKQVSLLTVKTGSDSGQVLKRISSSSSLCLSPALSYPHLHLVLVQNHHLLNVLMNLLTNNF